MVVLISHGQKIYRSANFYPFTINLFTCITGLRIHYYLNLGVVRKAHIILLILLIYTGADVNTNVPGRQEDDALLSNSGRHYEHNLERELEFTLST